MAGLRVRPVFSRRAPGAVGLQNGPLGTLGPPGRAPVNPVSPVDADSKARSPATTGGGRTSRVRSRLPRLAGGHGQLDVQQSIRFYDLLENLNKGRSCSPSSRSSRAASPSSSTRSSSRASRSGSCLPTSSGRPCARRRSPRPQRGALPQAPVGGDALPRRVDLAAEEQPVEWSKIRLNTGSAAEMKKALAALADTKKVYALEARMLGLAPMVCENGELPARRCWSRCRRGATP